MTALRLLANDLILFSHIVAAGSLTGAAERTGLPKATLSRRLAELEGRLGERLLQRSTRRLALTEFGQQMLEHALRLSETSEAAQALAQQRHRAPQGVLRASFPPEFRELFLLEVLERFTQRHPQVQLALDLSARRVDVLAERFDLAVRAADRLPDDATLVARHITTHENGLYASPAYLARHGQPVSPAELARHTGLMLVTSQGEQQPWRLTQCPLDAVGAAGAVGVAGVPDGAAGAGKPGKSGKSSSAARRLAPWVGVPERVHSANALGLQLALAGQGLGIVGLAQRFAQPLVQQGVLQRVLPDWQLPPTVIWCVTPGRRLLPQRTLAFIETLREVLGEGGE